MAQKSRRAEDIDDDKGGSDYYQGYEERYGEEDCAGHGYEKKMWEAKQNISLW